MEAAFLSGFASALLDVLFSRVTDVFLTEIKKFKIVAEAVEKLETSVTEAQMLLLEVDTSHFQGVVGHVMKKRVDTLTTLCYDADDVMDEIALLMMKYNSGSGKKIWRIRDALLQSLKTWTIPHGISKLQGKFDSILEQLGALISLTERTSNRFPDLASETLSDREGSNFNPVPLVDRDDDVQEIIQKLTSDHSNKGVTIVGMVGLGKTTLAQTIFCHRRIAEEFPVRLWLPISKGCFNNKDVVDRLSKKRALYKDVNAKPRAEQPSENNVALEQHQQNLLVVFDNLLEAKYFDWDDFFNDKLFNQVGKVKILITTLNPRISEVFGTCAYYLKSLSDESCEKLIVKKACSHNQDLSEDGLLHVAGELASKCAGLPLVARIIGLVLAKCDVKDWSTFVDEDLWQWPVFEEEIFPVLSSSYNHMQPHMKKCFAYFSLFPQNCCFNTDDLVQLWVGEGFIQQRNDSSRLERIGKGCIDVLLGRSILQFSDDARTGRPSYRLHKFSQNFAQLVASKAYLRLEEGVSTLSSIDKDIRHLSLLCENIPLSIWTELGTYKRLRTILSLHADNKIVKMPKIPRHLFKSLTRLRVLALSGTDIAEVPDSIYRLEHLRYLDVSNTALNNLPDKLSTVSTLKFLKLKNTPLSHLPKDFQNLTSLLFVDWDISDLKHLGLPSHIGKLSSLQTLPLFMTGDKDGYSIAELRNMNHLHGSICIMNLENVKNGEEAEAAMLHKKTSLKSIELQWNTSTNNYVSRDVLTGLRPPSYLKELKITDYGSDIFPEWISQQLPMLEKIHLQRCHSCTVLPALGQLQALQTLIIQDMSSIIIVGSSFMDGTGGFFPSLKKLEFNDMSKLQYWIRLEAKAMPRLRVLKFVNCPVMNTLPCSLESLTSLVDLQLKRCNELVTFPDVPTSLKSLIISESCKFEAQHFQTGGREWRKVKHIPYIEINDIQIQSSRVSTSSCIN